MNVLIAVDDDPAALQAAARTTDWLPDDASIVVVHVADKPVAAGLASTHSPAGATAAGATLASYPFHRAQEFRDFSEEAIKRSIQVAERGAETAEGEPRLEVGDAATKIVDVAEEIDADLIVVGTGDRSWLSKLFEPSVSQKVADSAPCSVLVVRDADPER